LVPEQHSADAASYVTPVVVEDWDTASHAAADPSAGVASGDTASRALVAGRPAVELSAHTLLTVIA